MTDELGELWVIRITLADAERLHKAGVDLTEAVAGQAFFHRLFSDPVFLLNALAAICERQIAERKLERESFARRFRGDVLGTAAQAVADEVINFFPHANGLRGLATLHRQVIAAFLAMLVAKETGHGVDAKARSLLKLSQPTPGDSPEWLEDSTHEASDSESCS